MHRSLPTYDCRKVKDQCKICLQTVSPHTGIQCQGACEAWVHYDCLNYTPGKVKDIEEGIITVTCPCPDCKTTVPKEYLTEEPFTCNNVSCPANNPPSCESPYCQANELSRQMPSRCPPPGTLRSCGLVTCREYSGPKAFKSAPSDTCMEGYTLRSCSGPETLEEHLSKPATYTPAIPARYGAPKKQEPVGRTAAPSPKATDVVQQMCKTVGDLAKQLNILMKNMSKFNNGGGGIGISIGTGSGSGCSGGSVKSCSSTNICAGGGGAAGGFEGGVGCGSHGGGRGGGHGGGHGISHGSGGFGRGNSNCRMGGGGGGGYGGGGSGCATHGANTGRGGGTGCGGGGGGGATFGGGGGGTACGGCGGGGAACGGGGGGGAACGGGGVARGGGGSCCGGSGGGGSGGMKRQQRFEGTLGRGGGALRQVKSSGSICEGCCKRSAKAAAFVPPPPPCPPQAEEMSANRCMGGCGKAGQPTCSQPCHCPGNPIQKH